MQFNILDTFSCNWNFSCMLTQKTVYRPRKVFSMSMSSSCYPVIFNSLAIDSNWPLLFYHSACTTRIWMRIAAASVMLSYLPCLPKIMVLVCLVECMTSSCKNIQLFVLDQISGTDITDMILPICLISNPSTSWKSLSNLRKTHFLIHHMRQNTLIHPYTSKRKKWKK